MLIPSKEMDSTSLKFIALSENWSGLFRVLEIGSWQALSSQLNLGGVRTANIRFVVSTFQSLGYDMCARYRRPLMLTNGEVVIMKRNRLSEQGCCQRNSLLHSGRSSAEDFEQMWPKQF